MQILLGKHIGSGQRQRNVVIYDLLRFHQDFFRAFFLVPLLIFLESYSLENP